MIQKLRPVRISNFSFLFFCLISARAWAFDLEKCANYSVQGFVRLSTEVGAQIVIHPGARSEYVLSFKGKKALDVLTEYHNIPIQARVEVTKKDQKFLVEANLIDVEFVLPNPKRAMSAIVFLKEIGCNVTFQK